MEKERNNITSFEELESDSFSFMDDNNTNNNNTDDNILKSMLSHQILSKEEEGDLINKKQECKIILYKILAQTAFFRDKIILWKNKILNKEMTVKNLLNVDYSNKYQTKVGELEDEDFLVGETIGTLNKYIYLYDEFKNTKKEEKKEEILNDATNLLLGLLIKDKYIFHTVYEMSDSFYNFFTAFHSLEKSKKNKKKQDPNLVKLVNSCQEVFGFSILETNELMSDLTRALKNYFKIVEKFLSCNYRLACYVASDNQFADLKSEIMAKTITGLLKAVERFNIHINNKNQPNPQSVRFITYALCWVKQKSTNGRKEYLSIFNNYDPKTIKQLKHYANILGVELPKNLISRIPGLSAAQIAQHSKILLSRPTNLNKRLDSSSPRDSGTSLMHEVTSTDAEGILEMAQTVKYDMQVIMNKFLSEVSSGRNHEIFVLKKEFNSELRDFPTNFIMQLKDADIKVYDENGNLIELKLKNFEKIFKILKEQQGENNDFGRISISRTAAEKKITSERFRQILANIGNGLNAHINQALKQDNNNFAEKKNEDLFDGIQVF